MWNSVSPSPSLGPICAVEGREQARRLPSHQYPHNRFKKNQDRKKFRKGYMPHSNTKIILLKTCFSVLYIKVLKNCPNKIGFVGRYSDCPPWKKKSWHFPYYVCSYINSMQLFVCLYLAELVVTALYLRGLAWVCWFLSFLVQSVYFSGLH
jgi:hypothetical protein